MLKDNLILLVGIIVASQFFSVPQHFEYYRTLTNLYKSQLHIDYYSLYKTNY